MTTIKYKFWCNEHGFVDCGFDTPIQEVFFNQRGELGRSCPLCFKSRPMKLVQFTGLTDKNGADIYEGDVVRFKHWDLIGKPIRVGRIEFDQDGMRWYLNTSDEQYESFTGFYKHPAREYEVIGNVYENSGLLQ